MLLRGSSLADHSGCPQWNLSDKPQVESNLEKPPQEHGDLSLAEQFQFEEV
jgi:hypothetical protein